jgi:hypothetical protein
MILTLDIHIDTADKDKFNDFQEAIIALVESAALLCSTQMVVTVPEDRAAWHKDGGRGQQTHD